MTQVDWRPGTAESKRRARAALQGTLEELLEDGGWPLTVEGGWQGGAPVSSSELWAMIVSLAVNAGGAVARFSEASR